MIPPPAPVRPSGPATPGRRAVLVGAAGGAGLLLTGCELNNPFSTEKTPAAEAVQDLAPDVALAVTAVGLILTTQARITAATTAYPGLAPRLSGLVDMHVAHLEALQDAVPEGVDPAPSTPVPAPPPTRAAALTEQAGAEKVLHDRLIGLALRAESGPFARLLGSMAAAVSQRSVELQP